MQIDDEIKVLAAHPADAVPGFRPIGGFGPATALETDDASQIRIPLKQWCKAGIDPPEDLTVRPMQLEEAQHRQGLHDVAERAGFENENLQRLNAGARMQREALDCNACLNLGRLWFRDIVCCDILSTIGQRKRSRL